MCESGGKSLEQLLIEGCALLDEGFIAAMRGKKHAQVCRREKSVAKHRNVRLERFG